MCINIADVSLHIKIELLICIRNTVLGMKLNFMIIDLRKICLYSRSKIKLFRLRDDK